MSVSDENTGHEGAGLTAAAAAAAASTSVAGAAGDAWGDRSDSRFHLCQLRRAESFASNDASSIPFHLEAQKGEALDDVFLFSQIASTFH